VRDLKPVDLIWGILQRLGQREWPQSTDDGFYLFQYEDIIQSINKNLEQLFAEVLSQHGAMFVKKETITPGSTAEHALTSQRQFYQIVRVVDENGYDIKQIDYDENEEYDNRGVESWYYRFDETNGHVIGLLDPADFSTVNVYYIDFPRPIVGGLGVASVSNDASVTVPWWGDVQDSSYATTNYVESVTISNHKPLSSSRRRDAVKAHASNTLTWDDDTLTGDEVFWCVEPEWGPREIKTYLVKKVACDLREGRDGRVPPHWVNDVAFAKQDMMAALRRRRASTINPESLEDFMN
jgi:hypothetical protein